MIFGCSIAQRVNAMPSVLVLSWCVHRILHMYIPGIEGSYLLELYNMYCGVTPVFGTVVLTSAFSSVFIRACSLGYSAAYLGSGTAVVD